MRRLVLALAFLAIGMAVVPFAPGVGADEPSTVATAEVEAFGLRVEYDIPLPASPGTMPHVVGEARRSGAGENAKGIAAAPTHFDAVVGGTYYDPDKDNDQPVVPCKPGDRTNCNLPPQTECFYPGSLVDTDFRFPTETNPTTANLPPVSYATARCGAGPEVELHAVGAGDAPAASIAASAADGLARPHEGVMEGTSSARAQGVSLAGGAITIGNVQASGHSEVTGKPGGAHTESRVSITDINAGGTRFDVANDRLIVGGQQIPFVSAAAQSFIDGVNAGLAPTRCTIALLTDPARYPQGFLLSRKEPRIGLATDGSFAGSMHAGLLVLCDLPDEASAGTDFKPQRLQAVVGFAYTAAASEDEPGGFGLGNLADNVLGETILAPAASANPLPDLAPSVAPLETPAAPVAAPVQKLQPRPAASRLPKALGDFAMDPATRWALGVVCIAIWGALTHAGARRLREILA
ncbi:MAG: hypothetical protein QOJ09_2495 [Actinomycetota bacterium]|nr:hypothetical protein [Actinomycetota bacterium]